MFDRPDKNEYPSFYETYISLIQTDDVIKLLEIQGEGFAAFVKEIEPQKADHRYAEGKWSIREVVGHVIEVERIMAYRALAISRADHQPLPGMDENLYIEESNYKNISLVDLSDEFIHVRKGNVFLFKSFTKDMANRKGIANGGEIKVSALVYIIAGHLSHHVQILRDRYLKMEAN